MALMGDWRKNKDDEVELDGVGGVSILVKADVHRSGAYPSRKLRVFHAGWTDRRDAYTNRDQLSMLRIRKSSRDGRLCENGKTSGLSGRGFAELRSMARRYAGKARKCVNHQHRV